MSAYLQVNHMYFDTDLSTGMTVVALHSQMNLIWPEIVGQGDNYLLDLVVSPPMSWTCSLTEPLLNRNKSMSGAQSQGHLLTKPMFGNNPGPGHGLVFHTPVITYVVCTDLVRVIHAGWFSLFAAFVLILTAD